MQSAIREQPERASCTADNRAYELALRARAWHGNCRATRWRVPKKNTLLQGGECQKKYPATRWRVSQRYGLCGVVCLPVMIMNSLHDTRTFRAKVRVRVSGQRVHACSECVLVAHQAREKHTHRRRHSYRGLEMSVASTPWPGDGPWARWPLSSTQCSMPPPLQSE
jgi:hypothetical protein